MPKPYLSFIIAGRNDGYGGDLEARFAAFLHHLHYRLGDGAELFEIVVCDWNPPAPQRTMESGFDWCAFAHVRFVTVPPAVHADYVGQSGFPILDYIARNVAIRHATGHFVCILNQDIYLSAEVADLLVRRVLDDRYFYRADRCDFYADFTATPEQQDRRMLEHCFAVNRRHGGFDDAITSPVAPNSTLSEWPTSSARVHERIAENGCLAYAPPERPIDSPTTKTTSLASVMRRSCLHTNASGDFIIAARDAFADIHGFVETSEFYMHLDSYAVVQLHAAGYRQGLFVNPALIFHADHDRSGRLGRREGLTIQQHDARWCDMLAGRCDVRVNSADWGLARYQLPVAELAFGRRALVARDGV